MGNLDLEYRDRINRVVGRWESDLGAEWDLRDAAQAAELSLFHFSRIFTALMGLGPGACLQELRLRKALLELRAPHSLPIGIIASLVGYDSESAFSRAFKKRYGMSPRKAARVDPERLELNWPRVSAAPPIPASELRIVELPAFSAIGLEVLGYAGRSFEKVAGAAFRKLLRFVQTEDRSRFPAPNFGLFPDDPRLVFDTRLRYWAGLPLAKDRAAPEPFEIRRIPSGRYLSHDFRGPYRQLWMIWEHFTRSYLAGPYPRLGDAPPLELYLEQPREVPAGQALTRLLLPLAGD